MNEYSCISDPGKEYSPAAFWFLYGHINGQEMCRQINMMYEQGVYQAFMHPRAFLETPYMGEEWWDAIGAAIRHSAEKGFLSWLYDEYAWPSGTCGNTLDDSVQPVWSKVLSKGIQNHGKDAYIDFEPHEDDTILYTYYTNSKDWKPESLKNRPFEGCSPLYLCIHVKPNMVDYLNPATIRDFLDCTHEEYKKRFGDLFGKSIPGIFFDEIYITARPQAWTDKLPEIFQKKYGYDLLPVMPYLVKGDDETAHKVRIDYYTLIAELYETAFFKQIGNWCAENNLILTGHTEEYFASHTNNQGHFFNTQRHMQMPGSDCHDYRYRLPRIISKYETRYAVSASRLYGTKRAMSEALGGAGWGCSLQEYKRGINVMGAMGINFFTLHGFHYSVDAQGSQADWPASFFYQNPYWVYFKTFADYIRRVSYMNTIGRAAVTCGLFYSIEQTYPHTIMGHLDEYGKRYHDIYDRGLCTLLESQIDTDAIDRPGLFRAIVSNGELCVGTQRFHCLVFPATIDNDEALVERINDVQNQGVKVILAISNQNEYPNPKIHADYVVPVSELPAAITMAGGRDVTVLEGDEHEFYINHRICKDGEHYMIANCLDEKRSYHLLLSAHGEAVGFSPDSGKIFPLNYTDTKDGISVNMTLEKDEAIFILINTDRKAESLSKPKKRYYRQVLGRWNFLPVKDGALFADETELEIPVARFASNIQDPHDIRIMNTKSEPGHVGRHLTNWHASWIARRQGWRCNTEAKDMYFRKSFFLPEEAKKAEVCIAAVNIAEVYINDRKAFTYNSYEKAGTFNIGSLLKHGENLISVHVHNDTPGDDDYTQARYLPHNHIISLLFECRINTNTQQIIVKSDESWICAIGEKHDWHDPSAKIIPVKNDSRRATNPSGYPEMSKNDWVYAWNRGNLPLHPFGVLPLFGEYVQYPVQCAYTFTLPVGTQTVYMPSIEDLIEVLLDGIECRFKNDILSLEPDGKTHTLSLMVSAKNESSGLHHNLRVGIRPYEQNLEPWAQWGLGWYAGRARYENSIFIDKSSDKRYLLHLGDVRFNAEVFVNGIRVGVLTWEPYELEITDFVKNGNNQITIFIANSACVERRYMNVDEGRALGWNQYWNVENIEREPKNLISGLLGDVRLYEC